MRAVLLALPLLVAAATAAEAAPWVAAKSHSGKCETMVPGDWKPGFAGLEMDSANGKSSVMVSNKNGTLAATKQMMPSVFKITKTYEDSAKRYWIEYKADAPGKRDWYVVVPAGAKICTAIIGFDSTVSEADAKTIATSLKPY